MLEKHQQIGSAFNATVPPSSNSSLPGLSLGHLSNNLGFNDLTVLEKDIDSQTSMTIESGKITPLPRSGRIWDRVGSSPFRMDVSSESDKSFTEFLMPKGLLGSRGHLGQKARHYHPGSLHNRGLRKGSTINDAIIESPNSNNEEQGHTSEIQVGNNSKQPVSITEDIKNSINFIKRHQKENSATIADEETKIPPMYLRPEIYSSGSTDNKTGKIRETSGNEGAQSQTVPYFTGSLLSKVRTKQIKPLTVQLTQKDETTTHHRSEPEGSPSTNEFPSSNKSKKSKKNVVATKYQAENKTSTYTSNEKDEIIQNLQNLPETQIYNSPMSNRISNDEKIKGR